MARGCREQRREEESSRDVQGVPTCIQLSFHQRARVRKLAEAGKRTSQMPQREKDL